MATARHEKYDRKELLKELDSCLITQKEVDLNYDYWDNLYGVPPFSYETYALTDSTKPGRYTFGPLVFNHEPFYIGHGRLGRPKKSSILSRQLDKYTRKIHRMKLIEAEGGYVRPVIISRFYTKMRAQLSEKKLLMLIPNLSNSVFHLCEVPLNEDDYKIINIQTKILTT